MRSPFDAVRVVLSRKRRRRASRRPGTNEKSSQDQLLVWCESDAGGDTNPLRDDGKDLSDQTKKRGQRSTIARKSSSPQSRAGMAHRAHPGPQKAEVQERGRSSTSFDLCTLSDALQLRSDRSSIDRLGNTARASAAVLLENHETLWFLSLFCLFAVYPPRRRCQPRKTGRRSRKPVFHNGFVVPLGTHPARTVQPEPRLRGDPERNAGTKPTSPVEWVPRWVPAVAPGSDCSAHYQSNCHSSWHRDTHFGARRPANWNRRVSTSLRPGCAAMPGGRQVEVSVVVRETPTRARRGMPGQRVRDSA